MRNGSRNNSRGHRTAWPIRCLIGIIILLLSASASAQKSLSDGIKDLAGQIAASATKAQKQKIAALPFRDLDGSATVLGTYLAEALSTHLVNSGLEVVERSMLDKVLAELKLQQTGAIDPASAKKVGSIAGVDAIITGSIANLNAVLAINCRLIDTQTGRIFAAAETMITRDAMVDSIIGQPASTPTASTTPTRSRKDWYWLNEHWKVTIDSFERQSNVIYATLAFENITTRDGSDNFGPFYLIDTNGERWSGRTAEGASSQWARIPAGTRLRVRWVFTPEGPADGRIFTLAHAGGVAMIRNVTPTPRKP
ncbi:MAG TPA: FlgO family outer membrane protein [Thermoanaerobaculia bacterium]|nr:FlgO family outer membrane protein [Thermoanaerobaculia bacterium]